MLSSSAIPGSRDHYFWQSVIITASSLLELKNCCALRQSQESHLTPASFDPKLIKGQVLWYFNTSCNLEISSIGRNTSKRTLFNLAGKALSGTVNQPLCHQAQGNRLLDSHDTPRERSNPDWTCTSSGDLKVDFLKLKQMISDKTAFPRYSD